jgi:hypothetical protein
MEAAEVDLREPMRWRNPMQYVLLLYVNESAWPKMSKAEQEQGMAAYFAYNEALAKAGALVGTHRLQSSASGSTIRVADGKSQVLDGPFADSKEQLGGLYFIDVPDHQAALDWAARCPAAGHGTVELRALWTNP